MRLAEYWVTANSNVRVQLKENVDDLLTIRYEDLIDDSSKILGQICDFCDLDHFSPQFTKIDNQRNSKYKQVLTDEQIQQVNEYCHSTRQLFGYSD